MSNETKKALLVVSFGTSHEDTRRVTIDAIEEDLKEAFPDYQLYRAWTSKMILAKLKERDQIFIPNVREAGADALGWNNRCHCAAHPCN